MTAEVTIATPLLLLLLMLVVQFGIWAHASHIAVATAGQTLAATRVASGTASSGHARAEAILTQIGDGVLREPQVTIVRGSSTARVEVTGRAVAVVPGLQLPVRAVAHGPTERFRPGTTP